MIHLYQPVALRLRMAVRGLSWAASAEKTSSTQYFCPNIGTSFRRKVGFGWAPPLGGQGWLFLQRSPSWGAPLAGKPSSKMG